ncbi:conjugal transfer protein TraF [Chromatiaceae bacterium AAb-1]|nr:conjugal transfer protein TraF [Chromatiaceae bacterium AAb-1]
MKTSLTALTSAIFAIVSGTAVAQQTDPRGIAMAGTGVAGAKYHQASFYNPALLTRYQENDDFALVLPAVSVQANDQDDMIDNIDNLQDILDELDANPSVANAQRAKQALLALDNNKASFQLGLGLVAAVPNKTLPFAVFARGYLDANVQVELDENDFDRLENGNTDLNSAASVVAVAVVETGITLAYSLDLQHTRLSFGVSPKLQRIETFFYHTSVADFDEDDFDADEYRQKENKTNLDLGVTASWQNGVTAGLVARNLMSHEITTVSVNGQQYLYKMEPQIVAGVTYQNSWLSANADVELTTHEGFGLQDKSQWAAVGIELDALDWAQLRFGYRNDLKSVQNDQLTAGLGLSPFGAFRLDLAGVYGDKNDLGAALQLSFTF